MISGTTPARNVHTGDFLVSKETTNAYRDGWERTFGKKNSVEVPVTTEEEEAFKAIESRPDPDGALR